MNSLKPPEKNPTPEQLGNELLRECFSLLWQIRRRSQYLKLLEVARRGLLVIVGYKKFRETPRPRLRKTGGEQDGH